MALSTLTSKGQVTIPKNIREVLQLLSGDKVEFILNEKSEVVLKPVTKRTSEVFGSLSRYKKSAAISLDDMNETVKQHIKQKFS